MRCLILLTIVITVISCHRESEQKFRIPAEWEPQDAVWLSWDDRRASNNQVITQIIKNLEGTVPLKVVFPSDSSRQVALQIMDSLQVDSSAFESFIYPGATSWIRDYGAVFAIDSTQELAVVDFKWNQYGQIDWVYERWPAYFEGAGLDSIKSVVAHAPISKIDSLMGISTGAIHHKIDITLEGGSFEYNGNGVLIQSEAVTLQRNPGKTKEEIEAAYQAFGIEKVIWLPQGVVEDEHFEMLIDNKYMVGGTGGHTDEFVRFANENTILLAWIEEDEIEEHPLNRENYDRMSKNYEILKKATNIYGEPFQIIKVPLPRPIETAITVVAERGPMDRKEKNSYH